MKEAIGFVLIHRARPGSLIWSDLQPLLDCPSQRTTSNRFGNSEAEQ